MSKEDITTILVVIEGIVKFMNNLDWNGRLNIILIAICVGFVIWVYNHRTETKITKHEKEKKTRKQTRSTKKVRRKPNNRKKRLPRAS